MNPQPESAAPPFRLWSLTFSVYLPTILFSIGEGMIIPITPLFAVSLGASVAFASLIVALRNFGQMTFDLPAGLAVSRLGDAGAMVVGTFFVGIAAIGAALSPSPLILGCLMFIMGGGWAFWQLARLAYVSELAPVEQRGRALSMLGGMTRIGTFIGPVCGGFLADHLGLESAFLAQACMGLLACALLFRNVTNDSGSERISANGLGGRLVGTAVDNRAIFIRTSIPILALALVRQARQVFLPLWGHHIGLDVAQIGLLTSISFFIDASVFYPSGALMDMRGRKWAAVPCLITMGIGLAVLPLSHDFYSFMAIAVLTGLGNGFGSGINMTLGADFAPGNRRGEFLGLWRLMSDAGGALGPAAISLLTALASLGVASVASGSVGFAGAIAMIIFVPETLKRRLRSDPVPVPIPTPPPPTSGG